VQKVEQGWISSFGDQNSFSEAVIVHFDLQKVSLLQLVEVHLQTHSSASNHSMRSKYRSAVYYFEEDQESESKRIIQRLQSKYTQPLITQVLPFVEFKPSPEQFRNYYRKNSKKKFCERYIAPKLKLIKELHINQIQQ
jgi:peptide-methionine (S)-S-oxide reductase